MTPQFWAGRRVFLTGHTGFKGAWLSLWLQRLGADLAGYAWRPPTSPSLFEVANVGAGMSSTESDVRDLVSLQAAMAEHQPEVVIHMAAQALVGRAISDPILTLSTNVLGTANLLEAVRHCPSVRAVVVITSDKCYENNCWIWGYRENDLLGGTDPYAASKASAELVVRSYRETFFPTSDYSRHGVALASARAGNAIGGGDWAPNRLVPDIVRALIAGEVPQIRNRVAVRPWQLVLEPLRGYLMLAERLYKDPSFGEGWNFGPDGGGLQTVSWIADYLVRAWNDGARWEDQGPPHAPEDHLLRLDSAKARALLGWSTKLSLATTLDWIVEWARSWSNAADMHQLCNDQIDRYEQRWNQDEPARV